VPLVLLVVVSVEVVVVPGIWVLPVVKRIGGLLM
jgi:hypothetical protein